MRAREITEIYRVDPQDAEDMGSKSAVASRFEYSFVERGARPVPGDSGLTYRVIRDNEDISIVIADPVAQATVGFLDLYSVPFPLKNAHSVEMIAVDPDYRGRGIAQALYGIYLSILKYPLISGRDQTSGGQKNWLRLSQVPGVVVRGYALVTDRWFDDDSPGFDEFVDKIMAMGGYYMGQTGDRVHVFSFHVVPGTGELEPAVKQALKLYSDERDPFEITGLYAVWRGK